MGIFFSGLFWGIILVILGLSIILRATLNIDIPVFKILFALILIYWGVRLLTGKLENRKSESTVVFNKSRITAADSGGEYNIIFGSGEVDLTELVPQESRIMVEVNVIFGSGELVLNSDIPVKIKASTAFGEVKLPKGTSGFIGDSVYYSDNYDDEKGYIYIKLDTVFGSARIISR